MVQRTLHFKIHYRLKSFDYMIAKAFAKRLRCVDRFGWLLILLRKFFIFCMLLGSFIFKRRSRPKFCSQVLSSELNTYIFKPVFLLHFMMSWLYPSFGVCLCVTGLLASVLPFVRIYFNFYGSVVDLQSKSVMHIHGSIPFQILFPYRSLWSID